MDDRSELLSIGRLAKATGLSVRTVRFWSDLGLVPPAGRTSGNYRMFDATAVARLDLVRTLRELGLDLDTVHQVLQQQATVAEVAATHVRALDAEIRVLRLRRAVLSSVAARGSSTEEAKLMHKLATLSTTERQQILDDFVDEAFGAGNTDTGIAGAMRRIPDLTDDATPEQVDAWIELAELVLDQDFRARVRQMATAGDQETPDPSTDYTDVLIHAGGALDAGISPTSPTAAAIVDRMMPGASAAERTALADQLATFTDRRVERYWRLLGILNGFPAFTPMVPAYEWLIEALRG